MEHEIYLQPTIERIDIRTEQGFAATVESVVEGFDREDWDE